MVIKEWIDKLVRFDAAATKRLILAQNAKVGNAFAKLISMSCDSWYWLVGVLAVWVFGREPWRERAVLLGVTIVLLAGLVLGIKQLVRRRRPDGEWGQVYRALDPHSFPSGHAARALAIALMGFYFGLNWVAIVLIFWAAMVGWSRVALRLHYLVDVLVGWVVGVIAALLAMATSPWLISLYHHLMDLLRI